MKKKIQTKLKAVTDELQAIEEELARGGFRGVYRLEKLFIQKELLEELLK